MQLRWQRKLPLLYLLLFGLHIRDFSLRLFGHHSPFDNTTASHVSPDSEHKHSELHNPTSHTVIQHQHKHSKVHNLRHWLLWC